MAFSRASLGAPWTWDTAGWQLPLALSTCHQSHDDQCFTCPSCQGGSYIILVIRCETFLKFESINTVTEINRRHRWYEERGREMALALKISQQQEQSQKTSRSLLSCQSAPSTTDLGGDGIFFLLSTSECAAVRAVSMERECCTSLMFMVVPVDVHIWV